jgi:hypothetical protein
MLQSRQLGKQLGTVMGPAFLMQRQVDFIAAASAAVTNSHC